jgi:hypothetical protein
VTSESALGLRDPALISESTLVTPVLTRNLSADGSRVFFETSEALVSRDVNGQTDVYEWEADGTGTCTSANGTFDSASGGCLFLISTGQSGQASHFGDASVDGSDVFFLTRQALVSQDQDENGDVYDARVGGGMPGQNPLPAVSSCAREACGAPGEAPPAFGSPASVSVLGPGNLAPLAPAKKKCAKGRKLSRGKCVKISQRRRHRARKAGREGRPGR